MSHISSVFQKTGHKVLIPYITVGYPDIETTLKAATLLAKNGADIIELGIPFSDPLADGATIQESSHQALQNGITPEICLETARKLRIEIDIPLVFMTYFNPILSYGPDRFCRSCSKVGIDGIIIPDLPPEEGEVLERATREGGLDLIYLLSPTSTPERIQLVAKKSGGFIYLVSVTGVTGARNEVPSDLGDFIRRVREISSLPLCVGFGISNPEQARKISKIADGIIIGSRLIQIMKDDNSLNSLQIFVREIREAIDK
jgi:tryptophan synthase alpha chain